MSNNWNQYFNDFLQKKKETHQFRKVSILAKHVHNFGSNDYLGLAQHPILNINSENTHCNLKYGAGSSHLLGGHHKIHEQLEQELALWLGYETTLLFGTGYMANLAATSLVPKQGFLFSHQLNHASIIDGGLLSKATVCRYQDEFHLNLWLEKIIQKNAQTTTKNGLTAIITDGVFSMDGITADFQLIKKILRSLDTSSSPLLMVDDAHGLGVFGKNGLGCLGKTDEIGLKKPDLLIGTFGKAIGTSGAFIACSSLVKEYLVNQARSFIYTTALSPIIASQTLKHIQFVQSEQGIERRDKLIQQKEILKYHCPQIETFESAIIPICVESNEKAIEIQEYLLKHDFYVPAIRPPTATPRLRISLNASHHLKTVEKLGLLLKSSI